MIFKTWVFWYIRWLHQIKQQKPLECLLSARPRPRGEGVWAHLSLHSDLLRLGLAVFTGGQGHTRVHVRVLWWQIRNFPYVHPTSPLMLSLWFAKCRPIGKPQQSCGPHSWRGPSCADHVGTLLGGVTTLGRYTALFVKGSPPHPQWQMGSTVQAFQRMRSASRWEHHQTGCRRRGKRKN